MRSNEGAFNVYIFLVFILNFFFYIIFMFVCFFFIAFDVEIDEYMVVYRLLF